MRSVALLEPGTRWRPMSGANADGSPTLSTTTAVCMRAYRSVVFGHIAWVDQVGTLIAFFCPDVGGALAVLGEIRAMSETVASTNLSRRQLHGLSHAFAGDATPQLWTSTTDIERTER